MSDLSVRRCPPSPSPSGPSTPDPEPDEQSVLGPTESLLNRFSDAVFGPGNGPHVRDVLRGVGLGGGIGPGGLPILLGTVAPLPGRDDDANEPVGVAAKLVRKAKEAAEAAACAVPADEPSSDPAEFSVPPPRHDLDASPEWREFTPEQERELSAFQEHLDSGLLVYRPQPDGFDQWQMQQEALRLREPASDRNFSDDEVAAFERYYDNQTSGSLVYMDPPDGYGEWLRRQEAAALTPPRGGEPTFTADEVSEFESYQELMEGDGPHILIYRPKPEGYDEWHESQDRSFWNSLIANAPG